MPRCTFSIAFRGDCGRELPCPDHTGLRCCSCGNPASRECPETCGLVCGAPICRDCEHDSQEGLLRMACRHVRKG